MEIKAEKLHPILFYSLVLLTMIGYYLLGYEIIRSEFPFVLLLFSFLFFSYFLLNKYYTSFKLLLAVGILVRILLLFSIPNLSDDVYRFIWDGRLSANGINPFRYLPSEVMQLKAIPGIDQNLFTQLNSKEYYTVYPPVLQFIFWTAGALFPKNVYGAIVYYKCILFVFELGNIFLIIRLLKKLKLPEKHAILYILNPLIIIELIGNVHFEGVMIFFVLLSFLFLIQQKIKASAWMLGMGIATKLLPVLFIPLIIKRIGWKKGVIFSFITGITTIILFALLLDYETLINMTNSVDLFFQNFEFNASIYYLARWVGTMITGYNIIAFAGPALSLIGGIIILYIGLRSAKQSFYSLFSLALFTITIWFLFATTVHPWYICMPVAIAVFTPFRFPMVWSFTATLSYSAYQSVPVKEHLWLIATGYLGVFIYAIWELSKANTNSTARLT